MLRVLRFLALVQLLCAGPAVGTVPVYPSSSIHRLAELYQLRACQHLAFTSACLVGRACLVNKKAQRLVAVERVQIYPSWDTRQCAVGRVLPQIAGKIWLCAPLNRPRVLAVARDPHIGVSPVVQRPALVQVVPDIQRHPYVLPQRLTQRILERLHNAPRLRRLDCTVLRVDHIE